MSENGKGGPSQTDAQSALAAVGIMLAILIAGFLAYSQGVYSERRHTAPHHHADSAKASASRACAGLEPAAMFECVNEKVERSEETARAEQDLDAQQNMALWAALMVVVSAMTATIAAIALWYVKGTLDETRAMTREAEKGTAAALVAAEAGQEANRMARSAQFYERIAARTAAGEARREREKADARAEAAYAIAKQNAETAARHVDVAMQTSQMQLRPWLKLDVEGGVGKRLSETENIFSINVTISNAGASPAFHTGVNVSTRLVSRPTELGPIDLTPNVGQFAPIFTGEPMPHGCSYQPTIAEAERVTEEARANGGMPTVVFDFKVSYVAAFSDDVKETALRYMIFGDHDDVEWLTRDREIGADILPRREMRWQPFDIMI